MINSELPNWLDDAKDLSDNRAKWDWLKFKIKTSSIIYSKKLAQERKKREEELNFKYQDALNKFQENPSEITRLEMDKFKNELETLYDERVEGIVVRARARWHEHGEKSSKYFLNLEKRNNIKKHVRKLYLSGSFSTDPFEILNAEKLFYSKLYSRQRVDLNSEQAKSFLENPNILKLSDELSSRCEGKITFEECESILGSFQVGKTPGNDGIPIEFYKMFWPLIGEFLVASFNEAFDKKEMSSSQKQALQCLDAFGFGPTLIRWVETFYNDITSCVLNNGSCTPYFELQRGVRQGDPLSPYLFIIAAEILAVTIRSREDIQGIMIGQEEFKLMQYADDLTLFVPNIDCAKLVLQLLDRFTICSGLKVNHTKTEAMWIGSCRQNTATPLGLRWSKSVKALGIVFTYNDTDQLQKNF